MNRFLVVVAIAGVVTAGSPREGAAQEAPNWADKAGAVGLGGNTTLGGTNGLNIRTWVSGLFGIQGTIGFRFTNATSSPEGGGGDTTFSTSVFAIGLYVVYKLAYWQRGSLSVLFGGDVESDRQTVDFGGMDNTNSNTNILLGTGLQAEYFPTQYLSVFAHVGLQVDFLTDDDAGDFGVDPDTNDVSGIDIALLSDLWGGAGFTVWFN